MSRGASSDSLITNVDTDLGPRVSFELYSLFPSSLRKEMNVSRADHRELDFKNLSPKDFVCQLWIVVLIRENM